MELHALLSQSLRPKEILNLAEWAEKHRRLSVIGSAEPGRYSLRRAPYLLELAWALSIYSPIREVIVEKAAQIGLTELGCSWVGYFMDQCSGAMLYAMPTIDSAKNISRDRIGPMIEVSPTLRKKFKITGRRDEDNAILKKRWPSGTLTLCGSASSNALRSSSVPYLFVDEYDAMDGDVDDQGDPVALAMVRSRNFERRKILVCSTPTTESGSKIHKLFLTTNQKYYFVPCLSCGVKTILKWEQLKWPERKPEQTVWECPNCAKTFSEVAKEKMLEQGEWRATNPEATDPVVAGYHISALYSPWYKWKEAARDFCNFKNDKSKLKTFVNTTLGETWKEKSIVPDWKRLYERRELYKPNTLPEGVLFLTCGVDIQKTFAAAEIIGWGEDQQSWSIDYRMWQGDPYKADLWPPLNELLTETWELKNGIRIPIRMMAVDTGHFTHAVYAWIRKQNQQRVIAVKGLDQLLLPIGPIKQVDNTINGRTYYRSVKLRTVGVSMLKHQLYGWLQLDKPTKEGEPYPSGYMHFPEYGEDYFKSLTAEECVEVKKKNGHIDWQWKKTSPNEALDCRNYGLAVACLAGLDRWSPQQWASLKRDLRLDQPEKPAEPRPPRKQRGFVL